MYKRQHFASHTTDSRIRYLKLIWLVRDKSDLHVLEHCSDFQLPASSTFEIFVTKTVPEDDVTQGYSMVESGNRFDDAELELEFMGDVGDADELDENGALVPVSYTHLDVYKRQDLGQHLGHRLARHPHELVRRLLCNWTRPSCCGVRVLKIGSCSANEKKT